MVTSKSKTTKVKKPAKRRRSSKNDDPIELWQAYQAKPTIELRNQLIEHYLPRAVENGQDVEARTQMLNASCMAVNGYLASLSATPVHNCSHAFGALYHIPHGDANGVFLPIVMECLPELYVPNAERLAQALNMPRGDKTGEALLEDVIANVRDIHQRVNCATDLSRWNVTADNMEAIIMAVASDPIGVFYPIPPEKIQEITLKAIG